MRGGYPRVTADQPLKFKEAAEVCSAASLKSSSFDRISRCAEAASPLSQSTCGGRPSGFPSPQIPVLQRAHFTNWRPTRHADPPSWRQSAASASSSARNDADRAAFAGAEKRIESKIHRLRTSSFTGIGRFRCTPMPTLQIRQRFHSMLSPTAGGVTHAHALGAAATIASTMRPSGAQSETSVVPKVMPSRRLITVMP